MERLKELIGGTKEDLEDQLAQVQRHIETAEASLRAVLQDDQTRLQDCLNSLAQAQQTANSVRPSISIQNNQAGQAGRTIFGTDTSQPQFNLTVSGNQAQQGAVMGSGVYTPQTLQALLGTSRTADLALAVQASQTQTQSTNVSALRSIASQFPTQRDKGISSRVNSPPSLMESDHTNIAENFQQPSNALMDENGDFYNQPVER